MIGIYQLCKYLNEGTLFCLKKWAKRIGISDRGVSKLVIRSHEFTTINQTFSFSRLDPFKQNKVSTYSVSKTNAGLKLMCTKWRNFQRISFYIHFWQMTTVVSTCLEKWEFLKFVIIWKAETWLQTQKSEHCTSLHCTALQCNRYKRPAPGQNFNSPQLPPNYYCYPSFVLWTFGDHEQNEQNELTTFANYYTTY